MDFVANGSKNVEIETSTGVYLRHAIHAPSSATTTDNKVRLTGPVSFSRISTLNFRFCASLNIFSSTKATTRQHSTGPRPEVICKYVFSIILFFIHSYDAGHEGTLDFNQFLLGLHHPVNILVSQRHFFDTATNQRDSGLRKILSQC